MRITVMIEDVKHFGAVAGEPPVMLKGEAVVDCEGVFDGVPTDRHGVANFVKGNLEPVASVAAHRFLDAKADAYGVERHK